jgi:hypothetical protein
MATGIYEWKDKLPVPDFGSMVTATKDPATPAPMQSPSQPTTGGSMFGGASFGDMVKAGPAASSPTPSFNDLFSSMGDTRAQNLQGAQQAIGEGFNPSTPSAGSQVARNSFIKAQEAAERKVLEQSALSGRDETGQIRGDRQDFLTQQALPQRMDFEAQLQAQEEKQAETRRQNAVGNVLAMEGLGSQERQADKSLLESARQFNTRQEFETWATKEGWNQDAINRAWQSNETALERTSREGVAFAGLNLEEKRLAQEGSQFTSRLDFDRWATQAGLDDVAAGRIWQSIENDRDRSLTKDENALDRNLTQSESRLGRELQRYIADTGFAIDERQLTETIRQFDGKLAFDKWATQAGLDDNAAARVWDGHLQDLSQKWQTGERLGSQEHQVLIEDKRVQAQTAAQQFDRLTNLEVLGKTQEWDAQKLELTNTYQTLRDTQAMSHEQAMTVMKGDIETRLTQMGVNADAARQAAEIEAGKWTTEREIAHQSAVANAELLFKYDNLREQVGLDSQRLNQSAQEIANQAAQFAQSFGLEEMRIKEMLNSDKSKAALGELSILMELAGDNPDMQQMVSGRFVAYMQTSGMISPEQAKQMIEKIQNPPPPDPIRDAAASVEEGDVPGATKQVTDGAIDQIGEAASTAKRWITSLF